MENNERLYSSETNYYYWLSFDGLKSIISMNPFEHLESEKTRIENKFIFLLITGKTYVNMVLASNDSNKGQIYPSQGIQ